MMRMIAAAVAVVLAGPALADETGRFQMQVSGDGGEGIEAWVLDTKTGAVRVCEVRAGRAECSGWNWSDPDNPYAEMSDEELRQLIHGAD